jgi:FMN reductase
MTARPKLVALSGSPRSPSRTDALVTTIAAAIADRVRVDVHHLTVGAIAPLILPALTRDRLSSEGEAVIAAIEDADLLVIGTPIYRASYTGLLKHVLDLVAYDALTGRIVVLAATGGSPLHGLAVEHQLRPLMSFFATHTAPTGVYATDTDFTNYRLTNPAIHRRIDLAVTDVERLLAGWTPRPNPSALTGATP